MKSRKTTCLTLLRPVRRKEESLGIFEAMYVILILSYRPENSKNCYAGGEVFRELIIHTGRCCVEKFIGPQQGKFEIWSPKKSLVPVIFFFLKI